MALKDIINTITDEAKAEAEKIKQEGKKKIEAIEEESRQKIKTEEKKIDDSIEKEAQKVVDRAAFESNIKERNKIVSLKQEIVDEVFDKVLEKIKELGDNEYSAVMKKLIADLPEVESGYITPIAGKEDLTRKALQDSGKNYSISDSSIEGAGGFVFKSKDIEVDNRFEELLKGLREELEIEISNKLFG